MKAPLVLSPIEQLPSRQVEAELFRRSFRRFARAAWSHVVQVPLVGGWYVDCVADHLQALLEGKIRRLVISIPPRHAKSTLASVLFPVFSWIDHPDLRWLDRELLGDAVDEGFVDVEALDREPVVPAALELIIPADGRPGRKTKVFERQAGG